MDQDTKKAQEDLERKRKEIKQHRESTLESVRSLLSESNIDAARDKAKELVDTPQWSEVLTMFKQNKPDIKCPAGCGGSALLQFDSFNLKFRGVACDACIRKSADEEMRNHLSIVRDKFIERMNDYLKAFGVPKRFINATMQDFPEAFHEVGSKDQGVFLWGDRGTGKTHLAVAIMRRECIAEAHRSVRELRPIKGMLLFVSVPALLLEIRSSFREGAEVGEDQIIKKYTDTELLVLDDLGVEKTTDWSLQTLYTLIDQRYVQMKKTVITSNLSIDDVSEKVGDRIASRIVEMCEIKRISGDDRRMKKDFKRVSAGDRE